MSQPLRSSSGAGRIFLTVFAIFWLGFSLVWEGVAIAAWLGGGGLFFMALFGLPFVAIGIVLLIVALKPLIVGLKLAPPEISLSADAVRVGEELRFTYRQAFKKPVAVTRIAIVFLFRESATYRQGTDTHTATHEEVIDAAELGGQSFPAGAVFTDERPLRIPPDAMHSFSASHNRLQWFVRLHVEISGWPDIKEEYEVRVLPERVLPEKGGGVAMAQASIEVILHGGDMEGSLRRYPPGAELSGAVRVIPDGDVRCNHLHVRLRWHTEGRGDRDESVIHSADVYQGTLRGGGGAPGEYAFQFRLPGAPWSYAGHYVNIVWGIAVEVDVPWSVNPRHEQPFILAPSRGGPETTSKTDAAAAVPASGRFDVFLTGVSRDTAQVAATLQQVVPDFNRETIIEMLRSTPMPVLRNVSPEQADAAARRLRAAGALIDVIPSLPDSPP